MLTTEALERILGRIPQLTVGVLGDLFLDRYLDLDAALTEPSIETGLDAYQVVRVRSSPGAAGTVINNLAALGVQRICAVAVIGDDGEGYELRQALAALRVVDARGIFTTSDRRTPTYTKPLLHQAGQPPRELNRLDIKNRTPLRDDTERHVLDALAEIWPRIDALLVMDQVSENQCGVVNTSVRVRLAELGAGSPDRLILADSRERIGRFRFVTSKPTDLECRIADPLPEWGQDDWQREAAATSLAHRTQRPVFCTQGARGILLAYPHRGPVPEIGSRDPVWIDGYPVAGPIDPVGAGDSTSAGIACAIAAGASLEEAAAFGNLVASITIQQIGTTGTATPDQVRQRWQEVSGG